MEQNERIKDLILALYEDLKAYGFCTNKFQYSRYWLNRSPRYLSALQSGNKTCSIEPLQNALVRIQIISDAIALSDHKNLIARLGVLDLLRENLEREIYTYIAKRMRNDLPKFHALANSEEKPRILLELD